MNENYRQKPYYRTQYELRNSNNMVSSTPKWDSSGSIASIKADVTALKEMLSQLHYECGVNTTRCNSLSRQFNDYRRDQVAQERVADIKTSRICINKTESNDRLVKIPEQGQNADGTNTGDADADNLQSSFMDSDGKVHIIYTTTSS